MEGGADLEHSLWLWSINDLLSSHQVTCWAGALAQGELWGGHSCHQPWGRGDRDGLDRNTCVPRQDGCLVPRKSAGSAVKAVVGALHVVRARVALWKEPLPRVLAPLSDSFVEGRADSLDKFLFLKQR